MKNLIQFTENGNGQKRLKFILKLGLLFLFPSLSYAVIPPVITGTYIVAPGTTEICPTTCTVSPGGVLLIQGNATAIFNYGLTVEQGGGVAVTNSRVEMAPGTKILIKGYTGPVPPFPQGGVFNAYYSTITTSVKDQYWKGIEIERINGIVSNMIGGFINLNTDTISYADNAVSNFNSALPLLNHTAGGYIMAQDVLFINNRYRAANIFLTNIASGQGPVGGPIEFISEEVHFTRCTFTSTNDFPYDPNEFVYMNRGFYIPFWNCIFKGKTDPNPFNTTGINAINSSIRVEPDAPGNQGGNFQYLRTGILMTNQLQNMQNSMIKDAFFGCQYAVNLSGCINPRILGNTSIGPLPLPTPFPSHVSFFLRNCPTFQMEGNSVQYDIGASNGFAGIVIMNSGPANNEVYRNNIMTANLDIQSIGTNRSDNGFAGMKILCNNLTETQLNYNEYNVSVMQDIGPNSSNGINNYQYIQVPGGSDLSAGNRFTPFQNPINPLNYYLETQTNDLFYFTYKYNPYITSENPVYRNFLNATTVSKTTCPVHNTGVPSNPFPFALFKSKLTTLETAIVNVENKENRTQSDTLAIAGLMDQHYKLIDSISSYYQSMDYTDSLALVYDNVTIGFQYPIYRALIYRDLGQFTEGINLLNSIGSNYELTDDETAQIGHLVNMVETQQWLSENEDNWETLPSNYKAFVSDYEQSDPSYAGAIARALLVEYEAYQYDPISRMLDPATSTMSYAVNLNKQNKIYPNPAHNELIVNWNSEGNTLFILKDIMGREVLREKLETRFTKIEISSLQAGIYLAQIQNGNKIVYQQKVIKK